MKRKWAAFKWKLHIWNIKLFHKDEWNIFSNGRMYNKKALRDCWDEYIESMRELKIEQEIDDKGINRSI